MKIFKKLQGSIDISSKLLLITPGFGGGTHKSMDSSNWFLNSFPEFRETLLKISKYFDQWRFSLRLSKINFP